MRDQDVFEKVKFDKSKDKVGEVEITKLYLIRELVSIAADVLRDRSWIFELKVCADGTEYSYSGDEITPEYKKIINAIRTADKAEIELYYTCYGGNNHGPFPLVYFLYELNREGKKPEGVDLSLYTLDLETGGDRGELFIFGKRGEKDYVGEVDLKEVTTLPEKAQWYAPTIAIAIEEEPYPLQNREAIRDLVEHMITIGNLADKMDTQFSIDDKFVSVYLGSPELNSAEEVYAYATEACKLKALLIDPETGEGEDIPVTLEFFSDSDGIPRMLSIQVKPDGNYVMRMASDE